MSTLVQEMIRRNNTPFCTNLVGVKTIEEGIKKANLDFEVKLHPLCTNDGIDLTSHCATVREDKNQVLGIVSPKYQILQNTEAFKFFEPFLENELATLETAGTLYGGKKVFILAKLNADDMYVTPEDRIEKYILLSNSHDGSSSIRVGFTPIRVVCCNMLSFVHSNEKSQLIRLNHKGNINVTLNQLRETMDLVNQQFIATEEQYKELSKRDVNKLDLHKYVKQVFSSKSLNEIINNYESEKEEKEKIEAERKRLLARVEEIFDLEPVHNAWTMYNSVNYYLNHERSKNVDTRYNSLWFGPGKSLDNKALQLAKNF